MNKEKKRILLFLMKWFNILFSVYLLVLVCKPCTDKEECNSVSETSVSINDYHNEHEHEEEACAPFCVCNCCGSHIFNVIVFTSVNDQTIQYFNQNIDKSSSAFVSNFFASIWQPPKFIS